MFVSQKATIVDIFKMIEVTCKPSFLIIGLRLAPVYIAILINCKLVVYYTLAI